MWQKHNFPKWEIYADSLLGGTDDMCVGCTSISLGVLLQIGLFIFGFFESFHHVVSQVSQHLQRTSRTEQSNHLNSWLHADV